MILAALILMGTFWVLSIIDDDECTVWRVYTGVMGFCILWTVGLALL